MKSNSELWKNGVWSEPVSNLMYWQEAKDYCQSIGGSLPTISELRTLVRNCPATQTGGNCKVIDNCTSHLECKTADCEGCIPEEDGRYSVFGDTGIFWSISDLPDDNDMAWIIKTSSGTISLSGKNYGYYDVRCIKRD